MNKMRVGVNGKILRVDLTQKRFYVEDPPARFQERGLGGTALGIHLLLQKKDTGPDPFAPTNTIIFAAGLLTATGAPTGSHFTVLARSPLTGLLAAASLGGDFAVGLKRAGYDAVVLEGRAPEPVSLVIGEENYFLPAASLWGKTVEETREFFTTRWGRRMKVMAIGPAGERRFKTATPVMDGSRIIPAPGVGAVMGAKNLKAIAAHGETSFPPADRESFQEVSAKIREKISWKFKCLRELSHDGAENFLRLFNEHQVLPTRNFSSNHFPELEHDEEEVVARNPQRAKRIACFGCPVGCRTLTPASAEHGATFLEGPDFPDLVSFGSLCGIRDRRSILEARRLCAQLGVDGMSMGAGIASAMSLFEEGKISEAQAGLPLHFGSPQALAAMLNQAARHEGLGRLLAEDPVQVARAQGGPKWIYQIHNQPVGPGHPCCDTGMDLHYRFSSCGTWPTLGAKPFQEELAVYQQFHAESVVSRVRILQDARAALESLGLCEYLLLFLDLDDIASLLPPVLGVEMTAKELLALGEKVFHAERQINREWDASAEVPGANASWQSDLEEEKVAEYFSLRNWDAQGIPKTTIGLW